MPDVKAVVSSPSNGKILESNAYRVDATGVVAHGRSRSAAESRAADGAARLPATGRGRPDGDVEQRAARTLKRRLRGAGC